MDLLHDLRPNAGEHCQFIGAPYQRYMLFSFLPPTRLLPLLYCRKHRHDPCFALEHTCSSLTEANLPSSEPHRLLPNEHLSWFCHGLQSGSRIHCIP